MTEPVLPWMRERAKFNHGWLSNHYLTLLDVLREALLFRSEEPDWEAIMVDLDEWNSQSLAAWSLIERFESEMSTSRLLRMIARPIGDPALQATLDEALNNLWKHNPQAQDVLHNARQAVQKADDVFREIKEAIGGGSLRELNRELVNKAVKVFRNVVTAFEKFRDISRY